MNARLSVGLTAGASQSPATFVTSMQWAHSFGTMLIETHADGSVWIDGKAVRDTLPSSTHGDQSIDGPEQS